ncbi:MAG TPA: TetR/AcrR family transcriptional regulator [Thermoleophilaceae bacterium]|nr:TetR/AcrR family transcriptional regulator [Thermoleophilaceae bacterium]
MEARQAATRERIVASAHEQVAAGGYASASVQAVAARAGVAVGTVYRHFPSKAELVAEVFRTASERELAVVAEVTAGAGCPATRRVAAGVEAFCRRALSAPTLAYAQLAEPVDPAVESERLRLRRGYRDVFEAVLADGVASGELTPHDTTTVAAALVGALGEALVGPLAAGTDGHHDALVMTLVDFCLSSLPTTEGASAWSP